jgi:hypothetical protein
MLYRLLLAITLFGVAIFWGVSSPNGFLKCANFIVVDELPNLAEEPSQLLADPAALLKDIPYAESAESPWLIEPDARVKLVFERGLGNCAYLSRGLARVLQLQGIPYNIIWLMDREDVSSGIGHTVVECPLRMSGFEGRAIIDILEGGVLMTGDAPVVTEKLLVHEPIEGVSIRSFNSRKDTAAPYYDLWMRSTVVGVTTSSEMNRYFSLLKATYVNFGYSRIEKLLYNVGAMVMGLFPSVYILQSEMARFDAMFQFEIVMARIMIWCLRVLGLMLIVDICIRLAQLLRRA